jgi:peptidoglycan/LPS O-acetylase OafA/YrhL
VPIYAVMCFLWWMALRPVFVNHFTVLQEVFPRPSSWWLYLTYMQNFWMVWAGTMGVGWSVVTWSLAVEEQFYLTLPAIVRYVEGRRMVYVLAFAIVLAPCLRILLFRLLPVSKGALAAFTLMPCRADTLLFGVLAAFLVRRQSTWAYLVTHKRYLLGAQVTLLVGVLYLTVKAPLQSSWPIASFGYTWLGLCYLCLLLIAVSQPDGFLGRTLRSPLLAWFGSISYGAYLVHTAVLGLAFGFLRHQSPKIRNLTDLAVAFFALCLTLTIAQLSWTFFEKPVVKLGHLVGY